MGPYQDHEKVPYLVPIQGRRSQLDLATVRYHALGAYAKSVYLVWKCEICCVGYQRRAGLVSLDIVNAWK